MHNSAQSVTILHTGKRLRPLRHTMKLHGGAPNPKLALKCELVNNPNQPFFQVALPVMAAMVVTASALISTNNKRLDDIVARLRRIEDRLLGIESRVASLEKKVDTLELKAWR
jgi:hypothetical protein